MYVCMYICIIKKTYQLYQFLEPVHFLYTSVQNLKIRKNAPIFWDQIVCREDAFF